MNFATLNKNNFEKINWNVNTDNFVFKKIADFYPTTKIVTVYGFFFVKSQNYGLQPVAILKDCLLNLPTHRKDIISDLLKNNDAIPAIANGECSLSFREYSSKYGNICYDFDFINTPKNDGAADYGVQPDIF